VLQAQRSEQTVLQTTGQRLPVDLFRNEAKQLVVGVGVVEARTGREVGRVLERDRQHFSWGPNFSRVTLEDRPEFRGVVVCVKPAAHVQQFSDGDLVAVWHARDVLQDWIVETELAFLGEQHDHCSRHRLGIGGDPEVRVGAG
jgi:hypothetical protein